MQIEKRAHFCILCAQRMRTVNRTHAKRRPKFNSFLINFAQIKKLDQRKLEKLAKVFSEMSTNLQAFLFYLRASKLDVCGKKKPVFVRQTFAKLRKQAKFWLSRDFCWRICVCLTELFIAVCVCKARESCVEASFRDSCKLGESRNWLLLPARIFAN